METRPLGSLWPITRLSISAAGLASLWGETPEEEGIATLRAGLEAGCNHLDVAPAYGRGRAERLLGKAMSDGWPDNLRLTTKVRVGTIAAEDILPRLRTSLQRSLATMGRAQVDLLLLHSQIIPDGWTCPRRADNQALTTVPLTLYRQAVVPAMRQLVAEGLCGAWGITAIGNNEALRLAMQAEDPADRPAAAHCIVNALESAGALDYSDPSQDAEATRQAAVDAGVGVLGIRLVQAGALTAAMDRPPRGNDERDFEDYQRAQWFRDLAQRLNAPPAVLAYRYGLSDERVDSMILGIKNRAELGDCLEALRAGPLSASEMQEIRQQRGR